MDALPLVSVIMPVFNGESFLAEALESVAESDYQNIELIIVNDGSIDSTESICKEFVYTARFPAHFLSIPRSGEAAAVNMGFEKSMGEYVMVLSADDKISRRLISSAIDVMSDRSVSVAYPNWSIIDEGGKILRNVEPSVFSLESLIGAASCLPGPGALIRKSSVKRKCLRNPRYSLISDYESWVYLARDSAFRKVETECGYWRQHSRGTTATLASIDRLRQQMLLGETLEANHWFEPRLILHYRISVLFQALQGAKDHHERLYIVSHLAERLFSNPFELGSVVFRRAAAHLVRLMKQVFHAN